MLQDGINLTASIKTATRHFQSNLPINDAVKFVIDRLAGVE
jgi:hypothetical protein